MRRPALFWPHPHQPKPNNPMIATLDLQVQAAPPRRHPNLLLPSGARAVERRDIANVPTPSATTTWTPIPHLDLVAKVEYTIRSNGLTVGTQAHSLSHDGLRYFGLME